MGCCRLSGRLLRFHRGSPPHPEGPWECPQGWLLLSPSLLRRSGWQAACSPTCSCCGHGSLLLLTLHLPARPSGNYSGDWSPSWVKATWQYHPSCLPSCLEDSCAHEDPFARLQYLVQTVVPQGHAFVTPLPSQMVFGPW